MTLGEHLEELRRRLIYCLIGLAVTSVAGLLLTQPVIKLLCGPYVTAMTHAGLQPDLAALSVTAGVSIYMKVAFAMAIVLGGPWIGYQLWMFVAAGLYPRERRYVHAALPVSLLLFVAGVVFVLLAAAPSVLRFLVGFTLWLNLRPVFTLDSYIGFMTMMMLAAGIGFQTPLVVWVLTRAGLVEVRALNHYRRHVIVVILIIAAVLTPSVDAYSQLLLAVPMWALYELGVLASYISARRRELS